VKNLPAIDLAVVAAYLAAMVLLGAWFSRRNKSAEQFTKASGAMPGWAVGISLYATFLSSNTFMGVPGKAFGGNWNAFVFSLSMPLAAWAAVKYFVPFYRAAGGVSAYAHLEQRFGPWARSYAVVCFLLTQLARMGSIFFGIALSLQALTGYGMATIMALTGACIVVYTVLGGMEAVIWTEVAQGVLLTVGGLLILCLVLAGTDGGAAAVVDIGRAGHKFDLGSFAPDFTASTFWVILLYGFFINLNNFGMDQNYVQRYHTAISAKQAARSVWLCVKLYIPISLLFFAIGTGLYAHYAQHPARTETIRMQAAAERLPTGAPHEAIERLAATLSPADYGDKVLPHFMVERIPTGLLGLVISAIMAAAMSTISSGMNASATVFTEDIYKRHIRPTASTGRTLRVLFATTAVFGVLGIAAGIGMIGIRSVLDLWWRLSGIFAGGMLGLFLLGMIAKKARSADAALAMTAGVLAILWMTFSHLLPERYDFLKYPLHANMVIVVGTLVVSIVGAAVSRFRPRSS